jgi:aerobic-type carbon monoxide dehydrogenase small subunit (CoxS/CutS family)
MQKPSKEPKVPLTLLVNGKRRTVNATPDTPLLYVLRDELALNGPMFGCGLSQCGACAVLRNGTAIRACVTTAGSVGEAEITTLEGLAEYHGRGGKGAANSAGLHPLQQAWIEEQVPQCGYCQSGMMVAAASLLKRTPAPSTSEIKQGMNGHLCRCGTQGRIVKAIARAAKAMA